MERPWLRHYDSGVPSHIDVPRVPLHDFLRNAANHFPQRACTIFQHQEISYSAVDRYTDWLAAAFIKLGLQPGEPVAIMMPNVPQYVLTYYAILKAGGVVVALNPLYKHTELEYQLNDSGARFWVGLAAFLPLLESVRAKVGVEIVLISDEEDAVELVEGLRENGFSHSQWGQWQESSTPIALLDAISAGRSAQVALPEVKAEDIAIYQYSGGTTGIPKGAEGSHYNLVANTLMFSHWLVGLKEGEEVVLAAIPLSHVYGMVIVMSMGVALGASLVLVPNARNIDDLLTNIEKHRATLFPGVPNLYQAINNHPSVTAGKVDLRSIKACISGSAPLLAETKYLFELSTGGKLMEGYGLSEAPTATHCNPMWGENRTGSIGLPLPDVDCRIVDLETGEQDVAQGEIGELIIRSPQVMRGYHARPDETALTLRDGWLYTGDIARMDEDGYFYLVDRKKELIKVGGFQVWPREVEVVLAAHPKVKEAAAAGVPDPVHVEVVKAWVVLKAGEEISSEDLRRWCGEHLAHYKIPALIEFRSELPRTLVGKVLRRELVRQHREQQMH